MLMEEKLGAPAPFTCPECHGPLWEIADTAVLRFRCHVGHAFTAGAMLEAQADEAESILWSLLRSREQRAELARRVADKQYSDHPALAAHFLARAKEYDEDAEVVRRMLLGRQSVPDEEKPERPSGKS